MPAIDFRHVSGRMISMTLIMENTKTSPRPSIREWEEFSRGGRVLMVWIGWAGRPPLALWLRLLGANFDTECGMNWGGVLGGVGGKDLWEDGMVVAVAARGWL